MAFGHECRPSQDLRRRGVLGCASGFGFGGDTGGTAAASARSFAWAASAMQALYALLSWFM
jgi:hypothetical protein